MQRRGEKAEGGAGGLLPDGGAPCGRAAHYSAAFSSPFCASRPARWGPAGGRGPAERDGPGRQSALSVVNRGIIRLLNPPS